MANENGHAGVVVTAPLASRSLVFVACATTGPDPLKHEIIEFSAVRAHPQLLYVGRELTTRVRPQQPERCTPAALLATGFDPIAWDDAPDVFDALARFAPLATGCVLAGHDVARTKAFLASGFRRAGLEEPAMAEPMLDTATLAWPLVAVGALEALSLDAVCARLGVQIDGAGARRDVARSMEVYRRLMALRMAMPPGTLSPAEGDEDAILVTQAARLAEGRRTYGAWDVSDGRNNAGEALLEVMDALNYCAAELVRLARAKGEVP